MHNIVYIYIHTCVYMYIYLYVDMYLYIILCSITTVNHFDNIAFRQKILQVLPTVV